MIREIVGVFLRLGAVSYGGPAIMGILQTEIQDRRAWLSKERFVEGIALVNTLPGPGVTQLTIFLGYVRAGWWGGLLAGVCFLAPAFVIMLVLTLAYARFGAVPLMRDVFYGMSPVVVGILAVAVYRLGRAAIRDRTQVALAIAGGVVVALTTLEIVAVILLAGAAGVAVYRSCRAGVAAALAIAIVTAGAHWAARAFEGAPFPGLWSLGASASSSPGLVELALFFFKVGAFTFGGGLGILAFMQDQVVNELQWLTPQQFLDGLALGQLTPGPIVILAAFVGYQLASVAGAAVSAAAVFLPSFVLVLTVLPIMDRLNRVAWIRAALRGVAPAVIGMIGAAIVQMVPGAVPNPLTAALAVVTVAVLAFRWFGPLPLMGGGAVVGFLTRVW